jgi:hypothetical protein
VSLEKTTKESLRDFTQLEKYPVNENLPAYFETEYPQFTEFLNKYYRHDFATGPSKFLKDLEYKRDFVKAQDDLLRFFSQELLLGRDYYDRFIDKQTAIQTSNLLYRSKGTRYSIQQFFRVFFGFDVDIRYGRDEVFITGDPGKEELVYKSEYRKGVLYPGRRLRFSFDDGEIQFYAMAKDPQEILREGLYVVTNNGEYAENQDDYVEDFERILEYNVFFPLRQEVDYTIDFDDKSVVLQPIPDGHEPVINDPWLNELAKTGIMPEGQSGKVLVKRYSPALSAIGAEVSDKRITNNGFWQMFALSIRAPISIKQWREAYKDFVHPAGMYLEGETLVQSDDKIFGSQPSVILEEYKKPVFSEQEILERMEASITELNIAPFQATALRGYSQSGFVTNDRTPYSDVDPGGLDSANAPVYAEERADSQQPDVVYRTRINDIKNFSVSGFTLEELDTQYQRMDRIDTIEPRRFDNVEADFSGTVNTTDENVWYGNPNTVCESLDSNYKGPTVLGSLLDFPPEYGGCPGYIFNLFGLLKPLRGYSSTEGTPDGDNYHLVDGIGQAKISAYRDQRVWGTTNDPGNNSQGQPFNYSDNVDSFGNQLGGTSRWDNEMDFANPFQYVTLQGVAKTMRTYYLNRDPITGAVTGYIDLSPGTPSPGDSADYMETLIMVDSAGGTGISGPAYLDSSFDSIGDVFP